MKKRSFIAVLVAVITTGFVAFPAMAGGQVDKVYVSINSVGTYRGLQEPELSSRDTEKYVVSQQEYYYYDEEDGGEGYINFTIKATNGYYFKTDWSDERKIIDMTGEMKGSRSDINIDYIDSTTIIGDLPFKGDRKNSSSSSSSSSRRNGWRGDYYYVNGNKVSGWKEIGNNWYFFDESTKRVKKDWWIHTGGTEDWYYVTPNGIMVENTSYTVNGVTYKFDASGKETSGKPIVIDEGGRGIYRFQKRDGSYYSNEWVQVDSRWFWADSNGYAIRSQWREINGKWYYFHVDGAMAYNTWIDGYYVGPDGARQ